MIIPLFDQTREKEINNYGECVRLSNELRTIPEHTKFNYVLNAPELIPIKYGFDIETCSEKIIKDWINNITISKSDSIIMFVYRVYSWRFPTEFNSNIKNMPVELRTELSMIKSNIINTPELCGEVGFHGKIRLDK